MSEAEFSRPVRMDTLGTMPRDLEIQAEPHERAALSNRFGLVSIDRLEARLNLTRSGDEVIAAGRLSSAVTQSCVATGAPVEATVDEDFRVLFRPQPNVAGAEEEIELGESDLDVVFYDGALLDVGDAVAETLSLALDPFPRAPEADAVLKEAGVKSEEEAGPLGALAGLKDLLKR